ncbi:hypothetical protein JHL21_02700 [Devosia sp. WQ 349]|uniref:hypothetical protein n=1 Tax=Devosia sp. WQ 349K1 TaxID=2800329 RepID=UPI001904772D|nr:hypothetical protein [Devosia sp. WQ 349K1]MBK1793406.1 hypothetical protein [Devosia sp. WQ 349K1]
MTRPAVFTQSDITKVVKGIKAGGERAQRIEIDRFGKIVVMLAHEAPAAEETTLDRIIRAQTEQAADKRDGVQRPTRKLARTL